MAAGAAQQISLPDAELAYYEQAPLEADARQMFERLHGEIAWRQEAITLFGKRMLQPRLIAWYGDPGAHYRYSGMSHRPLPWTPTLAALRCALEKLLGVRFNSALANLYRDHRDSMGLHADDEPELGEQPVIASLSFGEERVFRLKHSTRRDLKPLRLALPPGSLLVMRGNTQRHWKHEVPKSRAPCGPRINLTFRFVHPR